MIRVILNESQLINLFEAVSLNDIYAKYYSKIDSDVFRKIVESDPTWRVEKPDKMGKFGKWLLSLYIGGRLKLEDLYKAKEYLTYFVKYNNRIEIKDINKYKTLVDLYNVVKVFMNNPKISTSHSDEIRKIKDGAEKVYEDSEWLIIVPHTMEASCYYGKGTQWCTAADKSNNMFNHYNDQGNLYININKVSGEKYQFHFESDSFMDATDEPISTPIYEKIGLNDGVLNFYKGVDNNGNAFKSLVEIKEELYCTDSGYIVYYCTSPFSDWGYLWDEYSGEVVADRLVKIDRNRMSNIGYNLDHKNFEVFKNLYGYKTMVAITVNGHIEKISDSYIDVDAFDDIFYIGDSDEPCLAYTVDKNGLAEIYNYKYGSVLYRISADMIRSRGQVDYGVIYFKKKDGTYDLFDSYSGESVHDLLPYSEKTPWLKENNNDTYEEYIYMRYKNGVIVRINISNSLECEEIYDEEELDYNSMY